GEQQPLQARNALRHLRRREQLRSGGAGQRTRRRLVQLQQPCLRRRRHALLASELSKLFERSNGSGTARQCLSPAAPCDKRQPTMPTRLLCCVAAVAAASCIKRVGPSPGDDRTIIAGVTLPFAEPGEIPEGSEVSWDFG